MEGQPGSRSRSVAVKNQEEQRPGNARYRPIVMMVEDDAEDRRIYGTMLCYNGFDVLLMPDAATALRNLKVYWPDMVVLDLGLPDTSGLELCKQIRRCYGGVQVPVLVLSGFAESEMGSAARAAGCTSYIEKPTNPVHVLHAIEEILGRAPLPGEGPAPQVLTPS
jgi:DNA-binding response OmpR family regulator